MTIIDQLRKGVMPKTIANWQGHQDGGVLIMEVYSEVISGNDQDHEISEVEKLRSKQKST
jgi:hypothetical protein